MHPAVTGEQADTRCTQRSSVNTSGHPVNPPSGHRSQQRSNNAYRADKANGSGPRAAQARTTGGPTRWCSRPPGSSSGTGQPRAERERASPGRTGVQSQPVRPQVHPEADQDRREPRRRTRRPPRVDETPASVARCSDLRLDQIPDNGVGVTLPWGLRTVDGTCNNLLKDASIGVDQTKFGAADQVFPRHVPAQFKTTPNYAPAGQPGHRRSSDPEPRRISNLIVDQTPSNPAATAAAGDESRADVQSARLLHPERGDRHRPVRAVQLVVHPVRPVLRPRSRPGQQGRRRHGLRTRSTPTTRWSAEAATGHPAVHDPHPGVARRRRGDQPDDSVRRPEPDLHVAPVAPGLPA